MSSTTLLSIVIPIFNEEGNLPRLISRLQLLEKSLPGVHMEFVFIDDNSRDRSSELIKKLSHQLTKVRLIRFSKNAGSHAAIMAGFLNSSGDAILFMAGDLQDPPELILEMLSRREEGFDIVWAARTIIEKQPLKDKLLSCGYWHLANYVSRGNFPTSGVDFALLDRRVIDVVQPQANRDLPLFLLIADTGYPSTIVWYKKQQRGGGKSGWTLRKKLKMVWQTVLFAQRPLRALFALSIALFALTAVLGAAYSVYEFSSTGQVPFAPALASAVFFVSAVQLFAVALLGEYLACSVQSLTSLPRFVIAECSDFANGHTEATEQIDSATEALFTQPAPEMLSKTH